MILCHALSDHDPALAFAVDDFVFAEAIERHMQCKRALGVHDLSYSWRPIRAALARAGKSPSRDVLVRTTWDAPDAVWRVGAGATLALPFGVTLSERRDALAGALAIDVARFRLERQTVSSALHDAEAMPRWRSFEFLRGRRVRVQPTNHHICHAANAVYTSPFEEAVALVFDANGDREAVSVYHFAGNKLRLLARSGSENTSLGSLYSAITRLCGFNSREGEEWKVMGLAAYGERDERIVDFFRSRTRATGMELHTKFDVFDSGWVDELEKVTGPFRRPDDKDIIGRSARLACSFQAYFEEMVVGLASNLHRLGLSKNLALAGGCALNSSANGKIVPASGFERLHVPSAPADDGNALGALLYEMHHQRELPRALEVMSPYLGSWVDDEPIERISRFGGFDHTWAASDDDLCESVADLIASGAIIGWCQGRAEFGPRALGNRSILADPRVSDMREQINARVKFREEYRPLAPSILAEHGPDYFEGYQDSPFMDRALPFREDAKAKVPAVVHRDGTGRLQSVTAALNPLFHRLISAFHRKTGVPMLLNTSFNVMGKPIVHTADDAMTVFVTTGLDALVVGRHVLRKR